MNAEITREFTFEAAHHLPPVGPDHKCFRLHGHLPRVEVTVAGEVDPAMGWVMDFGDLARVGRDLLAALDHRVLNDVPGLGVPTSENLARWIFDHAATRVPGVVAVTVHESPYSRCTYRPGSRDGAPDGTGTAPDGTHAAPGGIGTAPDGTGISPERTGTVVSASGPDLVFSAAHFLLFPPDGREPIHGHDYRLRLEALLAAGAADGACEVLAACGRRAIADLEHRVLVPARPAIGSIAAAGGAGAAGDRVVLTVGASEVTLPAADCAVLDVANTTTEAIAGLLARRVAAMPEARAAGLVSVEAVVAEGPDATARAFALVVARCSES
ncbi:MAG: 6-carboxytetrahydropterin synthase QueD [Deltaproteobacteria bacterium]|nr:6-carboxytetrahydropterin synthase QueD [Deltaproteobacteria bacterium]